MFFENLPFGLYSIIILSLIPLSIAAYIFGKKKEPGNPINNIIWFLLPLSIALFLKRYVVEVNASEYIIDLTNIVFVIISAVFCIALCVIIYLSYKRGYADTKKIEALKPMLKTNSIIVLISVIVIIICVIVIKLKE